jgi:lipid-A-disaccharide synthase
LLVKVPFIGLPNILAGKGVVREFIQHEATPANMTEEIARILQDRPYAETQRQALLAIRKKLGERNGSAELARLAADMLVAPS